MGDQMFLSQLKLSLNLISRGETESFNDEHLPNTCGVIIAYS